MFQYLTISILFRELCTAFFYIRFGDCFFFRFSSRLFERERDEIFVLLNFVCFVASHNSSRIQYPTAMQSQGSGVPESRYAMSYTHSTLTGDNGADLYGHGPDSYVNVLQHQHQHIGHGGGAGQNSTGHGLGLGSQSHQHLSKRSADVAGLNLKQDPLLGDVTMSTIGMGHSGMDEGPSAGQNGSQSKKTPPPNGKKTKGRVKIKMEFIDNKLRRYTTFSKRKTGIMKKVSFILFASQSTDHQRTIETIYLFCPSSGL